MSEVHHGVYVFDGGLRGTRDEIELKSVIFYNKNIEFKDQV